MELSVVIPVHNEVEAVVPLWREIHHVLAAHHYEVIFVDDASVDGSLAALRSCRQQDRRVRIIHHAQRIGQSAALWRGVSVAQGRWIVTLDGDGQNDPADIPRLLQICAQDSDVVMLCGWRQQRMDHWARRWSSTVANRVRRTVLKDATPDTGCGLKLCRREAYLALPDFDHMHRFLPALVQRAGGKVRSVPVTHRARRSGLTKYGVGNRLWVGLVDLLGVWWLVRRYAQSDWQELDGEAPEPVRRDVN